MAAVPTVSSAPCALDLLGQESVMDPLRDQTRLFMFHPTATDSHAAANSCIIPLPPLNGTSYWWAACLLIAPKPTGNRPLPLSTPYPVVCHKAN
jgi:hypothetical protein